MSFEQILKSALQKGVRRSRHDWLIRPLRELDTRWLFWRFPVILAEESPFSLNLLRYHNTGFMRDREYLELMYHTLADAPKNRDAAFLASFRTGEVVRRRDGSRVSHAELNWVKAVCEDAEKGRPLKTPSVDAVSGEAASWREAWFSRLRQGGMPDDQHIIRAAILLTYLRGMEPFPLRRSLDDVRELKEEVPLCAVDRHSAEGSGIIEDMTRDGRLSRGHLVALWGRFGVEKLDEEHAPAYYWPNEVRHPGPRESIWALPKLRNTYLAAGFASVKSALCYWEEKLLPEIEKRARPVLSRYLHRPKQLSLFDV